MKFTPAVAAVSRTLYSMLQLPYANRSLFDARQVATTMHTRMIVATLVPKILPNDSVTTSPRNTI
ncbi:hypothetical protein COEREDRAFT_91044 [Coemansia reversa NRRL 1564]|uniref:Uncharacterized protein n=1 Tax=Coemansia reversa (strain ATCC 12441 / NRRL 1564) TaxID=763665 RepID=A0A2G5BHZ4_COERN|nr:hypothetical protein COEREDRAFT_91044 [Coemansia reversa NRRL 1564]|eukprot:PIA18648.1 hypothetical protein COEREDRAFT_91044 [Coemansia reversa NRRL 1564]